MKEVGFPGMEKIQVFQDDSELVSLLSFFLKISEGTRIKRTGWVQNGIRDPERIAGTLKIYQKCKKKWTGFLRIGNSIYLKK